MEFKPYYCKLKNFQFQNGEVLDEIIVEYTTMGTAQKDAQGNIQNGLLFLHGWSGDYTSFKRYMDLTLPEEAFDQDKYFLISTTALGSPGSSAPSTSHLKEDFPQYTVKDMINLQHRFLKEQLHIKHLNGVIGASLGGFQSLQWGVTHPDFMDFIISLVTSPVVIGRNLAIFQLMNSIIESHPDYKNGKYIENPVNAVKNIAGLQFLFVFSESYYINEFSSKEMLLKALDEQFTEGMKLDARDVVWRNNAVIPFDLRDDLHKTHAKSLIIGIEGDEYFPPEIDVIPISESIKNSELFIFKSELGHLGINQVEKMKDVFSEFMSCVE
ncbi:MAG: alpha/beta fold hydrolase [Methanobacterium sp.]|nr:alpha/beta fold hydrolase [Methanobacterium sp.]